ncbi:beta-lactamase/transpeptidase-like protein [Xylariaceae sp. FL1019]|nr:beta-lactamase/transpeptidase-like protein [Xylariaceae sp. FL1019]
MFSLPCNINSLLGSFLLLAKLSIAARDGLCPPLGPVLPAPISPSSDTSVQAAIQNLTDYFRDLTADFNTTGLAVAVQSIHEAKPMLEFYYTPPTFDANGTTDVNSETVFRLGSISKMFAILSVLTSGVMKMEDPVVKYVPELLQLSPEDSEVNDITSVAWNQVTIGSLASHLSGIGADLVNDLASFPYPFTQFGFPAVNNSSKTLCAGVYGLPACTRAEFFRDFGKRHPLYAPFTNPVYSNIGSVILGFAVEAATNQSYDAYIQKSILKPLGMTNTTIFTGPKEKSWGFIPEGDVYFGNSLGYEDIAGGFYSNTNDVLSFGTGILKNKLLPPHVTRSWMKPETSTSSPGFQLGGLWEIMRSDTVTEDQRLIEFYTKSGDLGTYNNIMVLIPDYDLVITLLSAGGESSYDMVDFATSRIVRSLLPAIEAASKRQADANYVGTFTDDATNSSITFFLDDAPGMVVSDWIMNGINIIEAYPTFASLSTTVVKEDIRVRLYPTNLKAGNQTEWRAVFSTGTKESIAERDSGSYYQGGSCVTWASMDRKVYGFKSLDEFIFETNSNGKALELNLRLFNITLRKET